MKLSATLRELSGRLGHEFRDPSLLVQALTHGSRGGEGDNQRLEFLGDRVLGLVMAEALLEADPQADEGRIAPRFTPNTSQSCASVSFAPGASRCSRIAVRIRSAIASGLAAPDGWDSGSFMIGIV